MIEEEFAPVFVNVPYPVMPDEDSCKYNKGVLCTDRKCWKCGWNPDNTNLRNARLVAHMEAYEIWVGE